VQEGGVDRQPLGGVEVLIEPGDGARITGQTSPRAAVGEHSHRNLAETINIAAEATDEE